MAPSLVDLIAHKRDGGALELRDLERIVRAFMAGELADYQMAAWLMAVYLRGMTSKETAALTFAMLRSGKVMDLSLLGGFKIDKHSTGGVGDKVSICLAPIVAACGVYVPMVSGRGLGHTGGTLDKLEAIPGFRTDLSTDDFERIVSDVGTCMMGQTSEIAPADKRMYALRDVTATVESIPLIVSSILSKKLAEGIDGLVLDVKVGRGAFMRDLSGARELATGLVCVGTDAGKRVVALLTDMNAPLGKAVGNANETREALGVLSGVSPPDLLECTLALGAEMLLLSRKATTLDEARQLLEHAIASGEARRVMERMVAAQGGDPRVVAEPSLLEVAPSIPIVAEQEGYVADIDALEIGLAAVAMGAGRTRVDQRIDHTVGISVEAKPGTRVARGQSLALLHVRSPQDAERVRARVRSAFRMAESASPPGPLVLGRVGG